MERWQSGLMRRSWKPLSVSRTGGSNPSLSATGGFHPNRSFLISSSGWKIPFRRKVRRWLSLTFRNPSIRQKSHLPSMKTGSNSCSSWFNGCLSWYLLRKSATFLRSSFIGWVREAMLEASYSWSTCEQKKSKPSPTSRNRGWRLLQSKSKIPVTLPLKKRRLTGCQSPWMTVVGKLQ